MSRGIPARPAADMVKTQSRKVKARIDTSLPGILPIQSIRALVAAGGIKTVQPLAPGQIQPASIDLRLGEVAYRVRASFLPGRDTKVAQKLSELSLHTIDLT